MRKTISIRLLAGFFALILLLMPCLSFGAPMDLDAEPEPEVEKPKVDSSGRPIMPDGAAAVLIEQVSGALLYESNGQKRMFPASTTKVMTCLLAVEAIERGEMALDEPITVTEQMLEGLDPDGTNMALKPEEVLTVEQLLWGLMIPSGNDAAMVFAFRLAGSEAAFAEQMNNRARELGCTDTNFVNPHGLHDDNHYTTAQDMAKIAKKGMDKPMFRDVVDIAHIKIPPTNKTEEERYYINTNGLISAMRYREYVYKGSTGIKTGRTTEAGACLVSSARKNGMELIGVFFHGRDVTESHQETARMLDWGFENYESIRAIAEGELLGECKVKRARGKDTVTLAAADDVRVVVPKGTPKSELMNRLDLPENLYAPLAEGQDVAGVTVLRDGQELGFGRLITLTAMKRSFFWPLMALGDWLWGFALIRGICYVMLAILTAVVFLLARGVWMEFRRAKRRKGRRNSSNH